MLVPRAGTVARYSADGVEQWRVQIGTGFHELHMAVDDDGSLAISGAFHGTATFGSDTFVNETDDTDGVIAKLDSSGTPVFALGITGAGNHVAMEVGFDDHGGVFALAGGLASTIDGVAIVGTNIVRLDGSGRYTWHLPIDYSFTIGALGRGPGDTIQFLGRTWEADIDFGGGPIGVGEYQPFLLAADALTGYGTSSEVIAHPMVLMRSGVFDGHDRVHFAGTYDDTIDLGTGPITAPHAAPGSQGWGFPTEQRFGRIVPLILNV